jgi:hypothetical protein
MTIESENSRSRLERVVGQSIVEILTVVHRGEPVRSFAAGAFIIFFAFVIRFSSVPFIREMGTSEFIVSLLCGVGLILAGMIFVFSIFFMLLKRTCLTS